jgi:hypothetical protein
MIKKIKTVISTLVLATIGFIWLLFTIFLQPQIEVGKILKKQIIQSPELYNKKPIYMAQISLCKNDKVKRYYLINKNDYDRLEMNNLVKFEVKRFGSKHIQRVIEY